MGQKELAQRLWGVGVRGIAERLAYWGIQGIPFDDPWP